MRCLQRKTKESFCGLLKNLGKAISASSTKYARRTLPSTLPTFPAGRVGWKEQGNWPLRDRRCSPRSEEHTSELQSHLNLVCRLLLEKKKIKKTSQESGQVHIDAHNNR